MRYARNAHTNNNHQREEIANGKLHTQRTTSNDGAKRRQPRPTRHPDHQSEQLQKAADGDYKEGAYLYADGILTRIRSKRVVGEYTYYKGKIEGCNVISDGTHYAHCRSIKEGIADLLFKTQADRGADQYKNLNQDSIVSFEDGMAMYRIITGACKQGTQNFVDNLKEPKEQYTVREIINLTRGQYGSERFREFFNAG